MGDEKFWSDLDELDKILADANTMVDEEDTMDDDEMMVNEFARRLNELNAMFNKLEENDIAVTIKLDTNNVRAIAVPFITATAVVRVLSPRPKIIVPFK